MLIIERKDGESIDVVLKRYKRKYQKTKVRDEQKRRREFMKDSVKRRNEMIFAVYRDKREKETA